MGSGGRFAIPLWQTAGGDAADRAGGERGWRGNFGEPPEVQFLPYLWEDEACFDMIEVWNGPMRPVNLRGIAWWTNMLKSGRKIAAVGGSDFHHDRRPVRLAHPVTAVYSASRSAADIVDAALHGRSYIMNGRNGVRLSLTCGEKSFGDTVAAGKTILCGFQQIMHQGHGVAAHRRTGGASACQATEREAPGRGNGYRNAVCLSDCLCSAARVWGLSTGYIQSNLFSLTLKCR